jgi:molybdopterin-binding protein
VGDVPARGGAAGAPRALVSPHEALARNRLAGTVTSVEQGAAIANVAVDVGGTRLVASITVEAVRELGLSEGSEVVAIVKASDVILGVAE